MAAEHHGWAPWLRRRTQAWKAHVFPLLEEHLAASVDSVLSYIPVYHEAALANLLEASSCASSTSVPCMLQGGCAISCGGGINAQLARHTACWLWRCAQLGVPPVAAPASVRVRRGGEWVV